MPRIDSEKFYTSAINEHGLTARGVNWSSKENQELRFDAILELLPNDLSQTKLVDAGCGFGDFFLYTQKKSIPIKTYIGIDSLVDMYSIASEQTACEIIIADIAKEKIPHAKHYICSGALNVLQKFEAILFIRNCFLACENSFVFNTLHGDIESETYNYFTIREIQKIADDLGVVDIKFISGYIKDDITVGFFK